MYNVFVWISEELSIDGIACIEFFNKFRYINEIIAIIQMSFVHQTFICLGYTSNFEAPEIILKAAL